MKTAVYAIRLLEAFASTGWRGRGLASFLGGALKLFSPRGARVDANLKLVYPEKSPQQRREMKRKLYEHLGWMLTEVLALQKEPSQVFSWVEKVEGLEWIAPLFSDKKGLLLLGGHFGNWELLGAWYAQTLARETGKKFYVLVQDARDKDIARLIGRYRERVRIDFLPRSTSLLELVRLLKSGAHIATMADISWRGGVRLPFMGQPCTNTTGPAILSMLASVPIVPISIYRLGPFRHEARFFPPLIVPEEKNRRLKAELLTLEVNKALERLIAPQPELWFWLHNRWK